MANSFYNNTTNTIINGTLANASDVENKCNDIAAGFDGVEAEIGIGLTISAGDLTIRDIAALAATRANTNIGFDAAGELVLNQLAGTYKGAWTPATYYQKGDTVTDTTGAYGSGVDALLVATTTHTSSGDLATDVANWDDLINTVVLDQAVADAQAAQAAAEAAALSAQTAETGALAAEVGADASAIAAAASETAAGVSETNAAASAVAAEGSNQISYDWAQEDEDVLVNDGVHPTGYSAYHWAQKAAGATSGVSSVNGRSGAVTLTAADVSLENCDNTSDLAKPISTATQTALDGKEPANVNIQAHIASLLNPHGVTATQVGLGNVDNTADADKPVSTAQAASIATKLNHTNGVMTGTYETAIAVPALVIDISNGNVQTKTISTNSTFTFTGWGTDAAAVVLELTAAGTETVTFTGATFKITPVLAAGLNVFIFTSVDGGTTVNGYIARDGS